MLDGNGSVDDGIFYDGFYSLNGAEEESLPDDQAWINLAAAAASAASAAVGLAARVWHPGRAPCRLRRHNRC